MERLSTRRPRWIIRRGFNGATSFQTWKGPILPAQLKRTSVLQWGHVFSDMERGGPYNPLWKRPILGVFESPPKSSCSSMAVHGRHARFLLSWCGFERVPGNPTPPRRSKLGRGESGPPSGLISGVFMTHSTVCSIVVGEVITISGS